MCDWNDNEEELPSIDFIVEGIKKMDYFDFVQIIPKPKHCISDRLAEKHSLATQLLTFNPIGTLLELGMPFIPSNEDHEILEFISLHITKAKMTGLMYPTKFVCTILSL